MEEGTSRSSMEMVEGYQFRIDMNSAQEIFMDEPKPLGTGDYPNAGKFLAAAVGNCLCDSLSFCVQEDPYRDALAAGPRCSARWRGTNAEG